MTLERDTILHNRYRILEILGEGGMGAVYKAHDENLGVTVAVKENLFTTEEYSRQFRIEATILASLRHPNLTRVTDHFDEGEGQYLVMDYIEGEDLRDRMERVGVIEEDDVIKIGIAICDALTYLHSREPGVLHRDVKPGNVKISPNGQVYLVDFGLAKILSGDQMTVTGARAMTPGYSPPEQYGTARTDVRSDIYSLGATLFSSLTAELPEDGLARAMNQTVLTPVRKYNPKVSRKLAGVIEKSLAVQPDDRYQTAEEFKKALINSRGITRRRYNLEDLVVSPPPDAHPDEMVEVEVAEALSKAADYGSANGKSKASMSTLPLSEIVDEVYDSRPNSARNRRRRRLGCWTWLALIVLLLGGGTASAFYFFPSQTGEALSFLMVPIQTATSQADATGTHESIVTATALAAATEPPATPTPSPTAEATQTPSPVPLSPTETPTPSLTPTITDTPTQTNTPTGGGPLLAFVSDRSGIPQIYTLRTDGSEIRQLTFLEDGACQPDWSPDGTRLLLISPCSGEQEEYPGAGIFIINADGTGLTPVTSFPNGDYDPEWSPEGSQIIFTSLRNQLAQIFLLDFVDSSVTLLADEGLKNMQPTWLADGSRIAFISSRKGPFQVWVMDPNGENQVRFSRSSDLKNISPVWSPDGTFLIFAQREQPNGVPNIIRAPLEADGMSEFRLTPRNSPSRSPAISPDGKWLLFESWPDGENHDIYLMELDTLAVTRLTTDPAFDFDPDWHPGG